MAKQNHSNRKGAAQKQTKQKSAPKAQPKPKKINMDAAVEDATPGNVMWKLGILACVAMIIISLLFASINGGSVYVGEDAKPTPTPTPPVSSVMPDDGSGEGEGDLQTPDSPSEDDETPQESSTGA